MQDNFYKDKNKIVYDSWVSCVNEICVSLSSQYFTTIQIHWLAVVNFAVHSIS